jgi:hypothetical protein
MMMMLAEEISRHIYQSSLVILPAETSGNKWEEWIKK